MQNDAKKKNNNKFSYNKLSGYIGLTVKMLDLNFDAAALSDYQEKSFFS